MRSPRKLIKPAILKELVEESKMGVPTQTILNRHSLKCTRVHLQKHIDYLLCHHEKPVVMASLNAPWIDPDGDPIQEQPHDWKYIGHFPWGEWTKR